MNALIAQRGVLVVTVDRRRRGLLVSEAEFSSRVEALEFCRSAGGDG
jgi:hypothetical protein